MDFDVTADFGSHAWTDDWTETGVDPAPDRQTVDSTAAGSAGGPRDYAEEPDEVQLLADLREHDEAAFAWLVRTHSERMRAVARRYFSEDEDVHDAVQEAFVAAFRSIDRFEGKAALSTWLHRIVVNACLMKLRTRRRKPEQSLSPALSETLTAADAVGTQRGLESEEVSSLVRDAIAALPEPHRSVIRLRDLEERDTRETARALVISPAAVKTRLHRARNLLREELASRGDFFAQSA